MSDLEIYRILVESFEILSKQRDTQIINNIQNEEKQEPDQKTMEEIKKSIETPTNFHLVNLAQSRRDSQRLITFEEKRQKQKEMYDKIKDNAINNDDNDNGYSEQQQTKSRPEIPIICNNNDISNIKEDLEYESDFDDGFGMINAAKLKAEHFNTIPTKQTLKRQRSEEEVIGDMRYIYDVDENDNRVLVRRKSLSKISGIGYSLQNK